MRLSTDEYTHGEIPLYLAYSSYAVNLIQVPMSMVIVGSFAAIPPMPNKWKLIIGLMAAIQWSWDTFKLQVLTPESEDFVIHMGISGSRISFESECEQKDQI